MLSFPFFTDPLLGLSLFFHLHSIHHQITFINTNFDNSQIQIQQQNLSFIFLNEQFTPPREDRKHSTQERRRLFILPRVLEKNYRRPEKEVLRYWVQQRHPWLCRGSDQGREFWKWVVLHPVLFVPPWIARRDGNRVHSSVGVREKGQRPKSSESTCGPTSATARNVRCSRCRRLHNIIINK